MKNCMLALLLSVLLPLNVLADSTCHGRFINPITDVCWTCLFPMTLGTSALVNSHLPDTKNPHDPICICHTDNTTRIGLTLGFWEPIRLVDITRHPFCLVSLGGAQLKLRGFSVGTVDTADSTRNTSFYHVHWYMFPLLYWLNLITDAGCVQSGQMDIAYLTELDPTWQHDELAFILNPEAALFANEIAQLACAAEVVKMAVGKLPIDGLFWCAGNQGSFYPLTGHVQAHTGGVQASTLLVERMAFKLHRQLLLRDSSGKSASATCRPMRIRPIMPKSRYRYQMTFPIAANTQPRGCKPFGYSTLLWGSGHEFPVTGEDFGYLVWRKRNCCVL